MGPDIVGPVAGCLMVAAIVIGPRYFRSKERQQMQETIRAAITAGQPLPPEVIEAMSRDVRPTASAGRDLRVGVVWLAIGAALAAFGAVLAYNEVPIGPLICWGFSAIPLFVGLAFVALGLMAKNKS